MRNISSHDKRKCGRMIPKKDLFISLKYAYAQTIIVTEVLSRGFCLPEWCPEIMR